MLPVSALGSALGSRAMPGTAALPGGAEPGAARVRTLEPPREGRGATGASADAPPFADTLRNAIDRADAAQKTADAEVQAFVAGESDNVHDAMIAMNEAELHFQLLTEVRNKLLDGYQELMRMQI